MREIDDTISVQIKGLVEVPRYLRPMYKILMFTFGTGHLDICIIDGYAVPAPASMSLIRYHPRGNSV